MDPEVENDHFDYSPYAYVYNNPILFIDPFGLDSIAAVEVKKAAENALQWILDIYRKTSAQCNRGVSHAFEEITGSKVFNGMTANEMVDYMESSDDFVEVEVDETQELQNEGDIIIAGQKVIGEDEDGNPLHGHVALGVPGNEESSKKWGGSAPVGMDTGENKRWSEKGMNWSWTSKKGVSFYKYIGPSNKTYNAGTMKSVSVTAKGPQKIKPIVRSEVVIR